MNEDTIKHLVLAHEHAVKAVDSLTPQHIRAKRQEIRRTSKKLLRLLLLDDETPTPDEPAARRPTRITID